MGYSSHVTVTDTFVSCATTIPKHPLMFIIKYRQHSLNLCYEPNDTVYYAKITIKFNLIKYNKNSINLNTKRINDNSWYKI